MDDGGALSVLPQSVFVKEEEPAKSIAERARLPPGLFVDFRFVRIIITLILSIIHFSIHL